MFGHDKFTVWRGFDDREANVEGARALGMKGIVVPQPWNASSYGSLRAALGDLTALV